MWPHQLTVTESIALSLLVGSCEVLLLVFAAYLDGTLYLTGGAIGLLQHPGILSILVGDVVVFVLCTYCARLTRKIGYKLPNKRPLLLRRFFRLPVLRKAYAEPNYLMRLSAAFSIVGLLALVNPSLKLLDPAWYYGHATIDAYVQPCSFLP